MHFTSGLKTSIPLSVCIYLMQGQSIQKADVNASNGQRIVIKYKKRTHSSFCIIHLLCLFHLTSAGLQNRRISALVAVLIYTASLEERCCHLQSSADLPQPSAGHRRSKLLPFCGATVTYPVPLKSQSVVCDLDQKEHSV